MLENQQNIQQFCSDVCSTMKLCQKENINGTVDRAAVLLKVNGDVSLDTTFSKERIDFTASFKKFGIRVLLDTLVGINNAQKSKCGQHESNLLIVEQHKEMTGQVFVDDYPLIAALHIWNSMMMAKISADENVLFWWHKIEEVGCPASESKVEQQNVVKKALAGNEDDGQPNTGKEPGFCMVAMDMNSRAPLIPIKIVEYSHNFCNQIKIYNANNQHLDSAQCSEIHKPKSVREILGEKKYKELKILMRDIREVYSKCLEAENETALPEWVDPNLLNNTAGQGGENIGNPDADLFIGGDVLLQPDQAREILEQMKRDCNFDTNNASKDRKKRQIKSSALKWDFPIPYRIEFRDTGMMALIHAAIKHIEKHSIASFVPNYMLPDNVSQLNFAVGGLRDCYSDGLGRENRKQNIVLGWCKNKFGSIVHEIGHALGLYHEQSRSDRDTFVWMSNEVKANGNNWKQPTLNLDQGYDYGSIMHYPNPLALQRPYENEFRKEKWITCIGFSTGEGVSYIRDLSYNRDLSYIRENTRTLGQRDMMSFKDAKMVNVYYNNCSINRKDSCQNGGYLDPRTGCIHCACPEGYSGKLCQHLHENDGFCGTDPGDLFVNNDGTTKMLEIVAERAGKCFWRIQADHPKSRIEIEVKLLSGFDCKSATDSDPKAYLEIKYRRDKAPTGARIYCQEQMRGNGYSISGELDDHLLVIFNALKKHQNFTIKYKAGFTETPTAPPINNIWKPNPLPNELRGCACDDPMKFFKKERNPEQLLYLYTKVQFKETANIYVNHYFNPNIVPAGQDAAQRNCLRGGHKERPSLIAILYCGNHMARILINGKFGNYSQGFNSPMDKNNWLLTYNENRFPPVYLRCQIGHENKVGSDNNALLGSDIWLYEDKENGAIPLDEILCIN